MYHFECEIAVSIRYDDMRRCHLRVRSIQIKFFVNHIKKDTTDLSISGVLANLHCDCKVQDGTGQGPTIRASRRTNPLPLLRVMEAKKCDKSSTILRRESKA